MHLTTKFIGLIAAASMLSFIPLGAADAVTDDTGVIDGLNQDVDVYSYLNTYNYHLWYPDNKYLYASPDNQVLVEVSGKMRLVNVFILGGGYSTDKGIKVGDSGSDVIKTYGPVFDNYDQSAYANAGRVISYETYPYYKKVHLSGYKEYYYRDLRNSCIYFIINRHTDKVVLIMYQSDMHGAYRGVPTAKANNLLPRLD